MVPVWDGFSLANDPAWMYMEGDSIPFLLKGFAMMPIFFFCTVSALLSVAKNPKQARSEPTLLAVTFLFILLLGCLLLAISEPTLRKAEEAKDNFDFECRTSLRTNPLYNEQVKLAKMRDGPNCTKLNSIEHCPGYEENKYSRTLKQFESYFKCSGFCYYPPVNLNLESPTLKYITFRLTKESQLGVLEKGIEAKQKQVDYYTNQLKTMTPGTKEYKMCHMKILFEKGGIADYLKLKHKLQHPSDK